ncbi:MAG: hypothetical protein ABI607_04170 [Betaproteobacteria bacterium]
MNIDFNIIARVFNRAFVCCAALCAIVAVTPALAQQLAPLVAVDAKPSRWQADVDRLDDAFRARMLVANDPRSNWVAGELDRGDIESQVTHFAAARTAAPGNKLYLSTLAIACMELTQPRLPECDAVDRLADWATRDTDNGWPSVLLADRARQHRTPDAMLAHLESAAAQPRFVEYWEAGSLEFWEAVRAMPIDGEEAAKLELAVMYAMPRLLAWTNAARSTCSGAAERSDAVRTACVQLGTAMRERGSTWMTRLIGARLARANVDSAEAKAAADKALATVRAQVAACARATGPILDGLEASDAATRAKAVSEWDRWLRREAAVGEARACEERVASTK